MKLVSDRIQETKKKKEESGWTDTVKRFNYTPSPSNDMILHLSPLQKTTELNKYIESEMALITVLKSWQYSTINK